MSLHTIVLIAALACFALAAAGISSRVNLVALGLLFLTLLVTVL